MRDLSEIAGPPELSDGRLRLRALRPEDKPAVVTGLNDPECGRFLWQPPYPYSDADFDEFSARQATAWTEDRDAFWTVTEAETGTVLAAISLHLKEERRDGRDRLLVRPVGAWARRDDVCRAPRPRLGLR